jgi:hypothetical protein
MQVLLLPKRGDLGSYLPLTFPLVVSCSVLRMIYERVFLLQLPKPRSWLVEHRAFDARVLALTHALHASLSQLQSASSQSPRDSGSRWPNMGELSITCRLTEVACECNSPVEVASSEAFWLVRARSRP